MATKPKKKPNFKKILNSKGAIKPKEEINTPMEPIEPPKEEEEKVEETPTPPEPAPAETKAINQEELRKILNYDDVEIQKEMDFCEKYIKENKKRIYQRIVLDAIYTLKLEQPIINCCKKINLSEFPNYNSETIGQLLGKQGQHKQAFVNLTKVNLEIDKDSKNGSAIVITKYNTIAVEKACRLIKKLMNLGKWSHEKMSALYKEVCEEWDNECETNGAKILKEFLKYDTPMPNLAKHVGNLQHIYSFNQNILEHSHEVAQISSNIAFQLGLDPLMAKRAGFFHDIGKAISNYEDHIDKGLSIGKEAKLEDYILNAIESHHGRVKPNNPYSMIVSAADKLSAGREGARPRQIELINQRKTKIENAIMTSPWVEKTIVKNAGNLIQIFIKLRDFSLEKIPAMQAEIRHKLRNLNSEYSYNYQIEFKLIFENKFFLDE